MQHHQQQSSDEEEKSDDENIQKKCDNLKDDRKTSENPEDLSEEEADQHQKTEQIDGPFSYEGFMNCLKSLGDPTSKVKDKKLYYILGYTGCGKSVLINFLQGHSLIFNNENGKTYITTRKNDPPIGHTCKSETTHIRQYVMKGEGGHILDTPGIMDTQGSVVALANQCHVFQALEVCKSLVPVIVFDYPSLQTQRAQLVHGLGNIFQKMFVNYKENFKSMVFLFNKVPKEVSDKSIQQLLKELIPQCPNKLTKQLFTDICNNFKSQCRVIRLYEGITERQQQKESGDIRDYLFEIEQIENPREVMQFSIDGKTKQSVELFVSNQCSQIDNCEDFNKITEIITQIDTLYQYTKIDSIKEYLNNSIQKVIEANQKQFKNIRQIILDYLKPEIKILENKEDNEQPQQVKELEEVKQFNSSLQSFKVVLESPIFKQYRNKLKTMEDFQKEIEKIFSSKNIYFQNNDPEAFVSEQESYHKELERFPDIINQKMANIVKIKKFLNQFETEMYNVQGFMELIDQHLDSYIIKLKLLVETSLQCPTKSHDQEISEIIKQNMAAAQLGLLLAKQLENVVERNNWPKIEIESKLRGGLDQKIKNIFQRVDNNVKFLLDHCDDMEEQLDNPKSTETNILICEYYYKYIEKENKEKMEQLIKNIIKQMNKVNHDIKEFLNKTYEDLINVDVTVIVRQLKTIQNMRHFHPKLNEDYSQQFKQVTDKIKQKFLDLQITINNLLQRDSITQFECQNMYNLIEMIGKFREIDDIFDTGVVKKIYNDIVMKVKYNMTNQIWKLTDCFKKKQIDYKLVEVYYEKAQQFSFSFKKLDQQIQTLSEEIESPIVGYIEQIQNKLKALINECFNVPEKWKKLIRFYFQYIPVFYLHQHTKDLQEQYQDLQEQINKKTIDLYKYIEKYQNCEYFMKNYQQEKDQLNKNFYQLHKLQNLVQQYSRQIDSSDNESVLDKQQYADEESQQLGTFDFNDGNISMAKEKFNNGVIKLIKMKDTLDFEEQNKLNKILIELLDDFSIWLNDTVRTDVDTSQNIIDDKIKEYNELNQSQKIDQIDIGEFISIKKCGDREKDVQKFLKQVLYMYKTQLQLFYKNILIDLQISNDKFKISVKQKINEHTDLIQNYEKFLKAVGENEKQQQLKRVNLTNHIEEYLDDCYAEIKEYQRKIQVNFVYNSIKNIQQIIKIFLSKSIIDKDLHDRHYQQFENSKKEINDKVFGDITKYSVVQQKLDQLKNDSNDDQIYMMYEQLQTNLEKHINDHLDNILKDSEKSLSEQETQSLRFLEEMNSHFNKYMSSVISEIKFNSQKKFQKLIQEYQNNFTKLCETENNQQSGSLEQSFLKLKNQDSEMFYDQRSKIMDQLVKDQEEISKNINCGKMVDSCKQYAEYRQKRTVLEVLIKDATKSEKNMLNFSLQQNQQYQDSLYNSLQIFKNKVQETKTVINKQLLESTIIPQYNHTNQSLCVEDFDNYMKAVYQLLVIKKTGDKLKSILNDHFAEIVDPIKELKNYFLEVFDCIQKAMTKENRHLKALIQRYQTQDELIQYLKTYMSSLDNQDGDMKIMFEAQKDIMDALIQLQNACKGLKVYSVLENEVQEILRNYDQNVVSAWQANQYKKVHSLLFNFENLAKQANDEETKSIYKNIINYIVKDIDIQVNRCQNYIRDQDFKQLNKEFPNIKSAEENLKQIEGLKPKYKDESQVKMLEDDIFNHLNQQFNGIYEVQSYEEVSDQTIDQFVDIIIYVQNILFECPVIKNIIIREQKKVLTNIDEKKGIRKLYKHLSKVKDNQKITISKDILNTYTHLQKFKIEEYKKVTNQFSYETLLPKFVKIFEDQNIDIDQEVIKQKYEMIKDKQQELYQKYMCVENIDNKEDIIQELKRYIQDNNVNINNMSDSMKDHILITMTYIFVSWTLIPIKITDFEEGNTFQNYLEPNNAQILSIMILLGCDGKEMLLKKLHNLLSKSPFQNHLVQVLTGEGKSILLGTLSTFFALMGYNVHVVCYSKYLSQRDQDDFIDLFKFLGVQDYILYGIFNELADIISEKDVDLRIASRMLVDPEQQLSEAELEKREKKKMIASREQILIIDEVDVFFSESFYGKTYNPVVKIQSEQIKKLILLVWELGKPREGVDTDVQVLYQDIKKSEKYVDVTKKYEGWEEFLDYQLQLMCRDVNTFDQHKNSYQVIDDRIGYKLQDHTICFSTTFGYWTSFAYCHQFDVDNSISKDSRDAYLGIPMNCGSLSYAETPNYYKYILGVTGTLADMHEDIKKALVSYKILYQTLTPSIFGDQRVDWKIQSSQHISIENDLSNWHIKIKSTIKEFYDRGQASIIFFECKENLEKFFEGDNFPVNKEEIIKLTEETMEKATEIKKASQSGKITLASRDFGRGTDFICHDEIVKKQGGVGIIQTFLSLDYCEEVQIRGRTGRQGQIGSYHLFLKEDDLSEKFDLSPEDIEEFRQKGIEYQQLHEIRNIKFGQYIQNYQERIKESGVKHKKTIQYIECLQNIENEEQKKKAIQFLKEFNKPKQQIIGKCIISQHIVFVLDCSGSMTLKDGKQQDRWNQVIDAFEEFIKIKVSQKCDDVISVIFYSTTAHQILVKAKLDQFKEKNLTRKCPGGKTFYSFAIDEVNKVLDSDAETEQENMKKAVFFLSDGMDLGNKNTLMKSLDTLKTNYGNQITAFWLRGFGPSAEASVLQDMENYMKDCGGSYKATLDQESLQQEIIDFSNMQVEAQNF